MIEQTIFQIRLEIEIWNEIRKAEIEFQEYEITDKRVIALKIEETLQLFLQSLILRE